MAEDWAGIATDIATAIASVGFTATLETVTGTTGPEYDPTSTTVVNVPVTVIDDQIKRADAEGLVTARTRMLTLAATVTPVKGWRIQVRGEWHRIAEVFPLAPGGVDLLFDVALEG